jgi:hypothetical protein
MLWGAGRLLFGALLSAHTAVLTLSRGARAYKRERPRDVLRLAAAVLVIATVSVGGNPVSRLAANSSRVVVDPSTTHPEGHSSRLSAAGWTASVNVEIPGERRVALPPPPRPGKRTALIIGINRAKGGRPLPGSVTDATNLKQALLGYGFPRKNISMLVEEDATRSAIRAGLADLAARTPADGVAVFAVATHTRQRGGQNELLTADGLRISASELGTALGRVRSKMWVALPTCYAGGYAVPGITGKNRIVSFASASNRPTYQLGTAGSYLFINMVREAMLKGKAPGSVEEAFRFAEAKLEREHPNRVPTMSDGVKGELVLGRMSPETIARYDTGSGRDRQHPDDRDAFYATTRSAPPPPDGADAPEPEQQQRHGLGVCGRFSYSCSSDDD